MARERQPEQSPAESSADAAARAQPFVVAIGASAGGLEALRTLFGCMPADSGAAFVVVAHRSPQQDSRLVDLLQPYTELPVRTVESAMPLEPNSVFVVPPSVGVAAVDTHVRLTTAAARSGSRARIDQLFRAVAAAHGERSIGALLTGAGSDGAIGLRQIKDSGGLVIVQDPAEAEYDGMPRSAIDAGAADLVLPLREIAEVIPRYCNAPLRLSAAELHDVGADGEPSPLLELAALLEARTSRDFSVYEPSFVADRVAKRMRLRGLDRFPEYLRLIRADADECAALASDLLQNATEFFADAERARRLEQDVLPRLFDRKTDEQDYIRAWCVGCGTGEDAYSVAMELIEECLRRPTRPHVQVFASDSVEDQLQSARLGLYPPEIAESVSAVRLANFFLRDERGYRVRPLLRRAVTFACHDVFKDFPFAHLDLIVCRRRLLRDLRPGVRRAALHSFHFALEPHGVLIVDAEDAFDEPRLFERAGDGGYIYRPVEGVRRALHLPAMRAGGGMPPPVDSAPPASQPLDARSVHARMLERYQPASVLIDGANRVVHYSPYAGRYVRLPGGEIRHDLLGVLPEPLCSVVRTGIEAVEQGEGAWISDPVVAPTFGGARRIAVHVDAADEASPHGTKLVVFEELGGSEQRAAELGSAPIDFTTLLGSELEGASRRLKAFAGQERNGSPPKLPEDEAELAAIVEDLEMAKEELQTVNEELFALNQENRTRLDELARLSTDLEVLLESTGVATLFLDRELKVVRFTPPLLDIFNVLPADQGRPFSDLRHRLLDQDLVGDAQRVLKHLTPMDREVQGENGRWYLLRMLPYRTPPHGIAGVALTLIDITTRKRAEQRLVDNDRRKDEFIALLAHELRNPLAPISSGIEILRRRDLDAATAERVTMTMARQAAQLVRLIDDLLDVSRISSGRLRLRKGLVAVADVVRDAVAAVRPLIERSRHDLVVTLPAEPIVLDGDAARLTQVLANLLNNAARYTASGGKIELAVRHDADSVVISVKDNGYGISEAALPHVFEMFYQGSDPRASPQAGLGIGLALAKSLVDMHGGTIDVASAGVDRGSEFTLRLPANVHHEMPAAADSHPVTDALGGHRVLVVDDNADAAQTLAFLIRALGENEVHVAFSGAEALPLAERVKPDTVFLDLKMPEMDGYEVAQRLRSEPWASGAWLVALTGWGLDEHKRRTKEAGFDQHLTKPADRAALESILARNQGARA